MPASLPGGDVGVSTSFPTISFLFEAVLSEYLSRMQRLSKGSHVVHFVPKINWPHGLNRRMIDIYRQTRCSPCKWCAHSGSTQLYYNTMLNRFNFLITSKITILLDWYVPMLLKTVHSGGWVEWKIAFPGCIVGTWGGWLDLHHRVQETNAHWQVPGLLIAPPPGTQNCSGQDPSWQGGSHQFLGCAQGQWDQACQAGPWYEWLPQGGSGKVLWYYQSSPRG